MLSAHLSELARWTSISSIHNYPHDDDDKDDHGGLHDDGELHDHG